MEESVFQTLLLLAYFNIALISVAIANFAVSASFLGRETQLSRRRMESKRAKLVEKLSKLKKEVELKEVEKQVKETKDERRRLSIRLFLLSWLGAVVLPSIFFGFSFICAVIGMNSEILPTNISQFVKQQTIIFSIGAMGIGLMVLLFVIRTIDSAAREIPLPEFKVYFENGLRTIKCKKKEEKDNLLHVENTGDVVAEDLLVFFLFPPEFVINERKFKYEVYKQSPDSDHPSYTAAIVRPHNIHIGTTFVSEISIIMPEKEDVYDVFVEIYEKKMGVFKEKLSIEVTA